MAPLALPQSVAKMCQGDMQRQSLGNTRKEQPAKGERGACGLWGQKLSILKWREDQRAQEELCAGIYGALQACGAERAQHGMEEEGDLT